MLLFNTYTLQAQTCTNATNLPPNGQLEIGVIQNGEYWFKLNTSNPLKRIYGYWQNGLTAPTRLTIFSGACSLLTSITSANFIDMHDSINQFVVNLIPGSYLIKIEGDDDLTVWLSAPEALEDINCESVGCNLTPNMSFENHNFITPTSPPFGIPWGQIEWATCWDNPSTNQNATPDYARDHAPFCTPTSFGNRCKTSPQSTFETWPNIPSQMGTAHFFVHHNNTLLPNAVNRREYITTILRDNTGMISGMEPNRTYFFALRARNNAEYRFYNDALGAIFTQGPITVNHNGLITVPGALEINFTGQPTPTGYNNLDWRHYGSFVENDNAFRNTITIGNFQNNANTIARSIDANPNITGANWQFAAVYIDHVELYEMPTAGANITACEGDLLTLGHLPDCVTPGVTVQWFDANFNLISTQLQLNINALPGNTTYTQFIQFEGFVNFTQVTVTGHPISLSTQSVNDQLCDGNLAFKINNYNSSYSYSIDFVDLTGSYSINTTTGDVTITNTAFTGLYGMGQVLIKVSNVSDCELIDTYTVYDCCENSPQGIFAFNDQMSNIFQGGGGETYIVYGTLTIDDNFHFNDCFFFLQPDAQIVLKNDIHVVFNNCRFSSCNNFKWDRVFTNQPTTIVEFMDCHIAQALRGVHSEDDATVNLLQNTFEDNTISQYCYRYASASSSLMWQQNMFQMYPTNSLTQQNPNSLVPMNTILTIPPGVETVGIKLDQVNDYSLANGNTFVSDFNLQPSWDEHLHVWPKNSSGSVVSNIFHEGGNVFIDGGTATVTGNTFQKSAQPNSFPKGISALQADAHISYNDLQDHASVVAQNPIKTTVVYNIINYAAQGINIFNDAPNESRTVIQNNSINAAEGILTKNITTLWPQSGSTTNRLLINNNTITLSHPTNTNALMADVVGIHTQNCPGVSIGQNTIEVADVQNGAYPDANNFLKAIGIKLVESPNGMVGCNTIDYAGAGLAIYGDAKRHAWQSSNQYQSNVFGSNYHGIYLHNNCEVLDFGSSALGADNQWVNIGANYQVGSRIFDNRVSPNNIAINYFFSGGTPNPRNPQLPQGALIISYPNAGVNNCNNAPTDNKKEDIESESKLALYPNPAKDFVTITYSDFYQAMDVLLINTMGQVLISEKFTNGFAEIGIAHLAKGIYVVIVNVDGYVFSEKIIIQ